MTDTVSIKGIGTAAKTCYSLVKGVGPLLISQFDYTKFKWLDYQQKQAQLAGYTEFLLAETRSLVELKSEQMRDSLAKTGLDRIRAEENIKLLTKEINKLLTYAKVPSQTLYLESQKSHSEEIPDNKNEEINDTWIYRFNELAEKLNEEWRQNLLAKAFAIEADKPGTIGLDTLFTIGMLDQKSFYLFAGILSSSIKMYETHLLPVDQETLDIKLDINGSSYAITNILYQLEHTGLILYNTDLGINLTQGKLVKFQYQNNILEAISPKNDHIPAIVTSRAGSALASMCTVTSNETGLKFFASLENKLLQRNALHKKYVV
ncbi:DUF2806 domain-containing protein [Pseudomonas sp. RA_105y_Pfl1_P41]|uniref:DUF2806 domain-containing protein n=1 Tax=Pseudomonas sp. RA_105y_Pfl1_P41 TaxID=3088700 RepID=UPI0030DC87BC